MKARLIAACVLAAGSLLAGCQTTVPGTPQHNAQNPTEPSFPTSRPSRTTPTTTRTPPPATPAPSAAPAPGAVVLAPQNGYVFVETKSGLTRCQLNETEVDCEAPFTDPPTVNGSPANGVRLTAAGQVQWIVGNLGDIPVQTLDYRTYAAVGWTIVASEDGTRFTNDATRHGMFVSIGKVDVF